MYANPQSNGSNIHLRSIELLAEVQCFLRLQSHQPRHECRHMMRILRAHEDRATNPLMALVRGQSTLQLQVR